MVAVGRDRVGLEETARGERSIDVVEADVTEPAGQASVFQGRRRLHALVNDAGVGWTGLVEDMPLEEIDRIIALNVSALIRLTRLALERLGDGGHIVNIGSVLGLVASPPLTVYSASKFAVRGFSQGLRRELAGRGISVTEIRPGPVDTAFFTRSVQRPAAADIPSFPMFDPDRVAAAVRRALERPGWPGYRTISVPRAAALSHLGALAGGNALVDALARVTRSDAVLRPGPARGHAGPTSAGRAGSPGAIRPPER